MSRFGGRVVGWPSAPKPVSTPISPISGTYFFAGSVRAILPSSTSCMMQVPAIALVVEKIANTLSVVIGWSWPSSRLPLAPS